MQKILAKLIKQKEFKLRAEGRSMLPILLPEDIVYYKTASFKELMVNDIVLARKNNKLLTHEVIYKTSSYIITKGCNNLESDGKISRNQVVARAYKVRRGGNEFYIEDIYLLQSSVYFQEIIKVKNLLQKQGVDFVFLKGLPLHLYYEKTHPRRIYADCDILIKKNDYSKVKEIMNELKYKEADLHWSQTQKKLQEREVEVSFVKQIGKVLVIFDIHLEIDLTVVHLGRLEELYPQKLIDGLTEDFLKTKREITVQSSAFNILSINNLTLYLALHFFHHNFQGIFRLKFIDKVIRKEKLTVNDWNSSMSTINKYRLTNFVYPVFILLKKLYKTPIPDSFLKSIQPSTFQLQYLSSILEHPSSVFDDEPRIKAGVNRFKYLFLLSPNPWWKKIMIMFNPQVAFSVLWVFQKKLSLFFLNRK